MVTKTFAFGTLLAAFASANGQAVTFNRTFTLGQKDVYAVSVERTGPKPGTIGMTETFEVTKLNDDGGAEVTIAVSDLTRNGNVIALPPSVASGFKMIELFNKQGFPYQMKPGPAMVSGMPLMSGATFSDGLTLGQPLTFDVSTSSIKGSKGSVTLTDLTAGVAIIHFVSDTVDGATTTHADGVCTFDMSKGRFIKIDFKTTSTADGGSGTHLTMALRTN